MIDLDYAARQMAGVWKMAWNRPDWTASLDRSVDGVFRSFWAIAVAAPFAIAGFFSLRRAASRIEDFPTSALLEAPPAFALASDSVAFLVDWAASLAALILVARAIGASRRIADVIIGFNWMQAMITIAQAAPIAIIGASARREFIAILLLPATAFVIALMWGVLRRSLEASVSVTIATIIFLTLLGFIVRAIIGTIAVGALHAFS